MGYIDKTEKTKIRFNDFQIFLSVIRIATSKLPPLTKGTLYSRDPPFVPAHGMIPPLRMLNLFPAPHPSYRDQQASPPYEGYACFSPPTLRTCPGIAPPAANGKLVSRAPPFVSQPASSFPLRRVRLFLPPTLRTCPGIAPPAANGKLVSRSPPFVSRPARFSSLRRVRLILPAHPSYLPRDSSPRYEW